MSLNSRLVDALDGLAPEPPAADTYKGTQALYIVFNYTLIPADFGDDDAGHYRALVQVHLYAPHEKNTVSLRKEISRRLVAAGFTRPSVTPASDAKGQHYAFECEDIEAVE
ncbi:MAG: phage tail protein [Oscillospiraceae bacterium]|nr:phage tail protein [Oscillospiraceae bacterium]